jgi:hypothetical protein
MAIIRLHSVSLQPAVAVAVLHNRWVYTLMVLPVDLAAVPLLIHMSFNTIFMRQVKVQPVAELVDKVITANNAMAQNPAAVAVAQEKPAVLTSHPRVATDLRRQLLALQ